MLRNTSGASRIPSLDGARAVSIGLVVLSHLAILASLPLVWRFADQDFYGYGRYLDVGNLGVRVFFTISGFLITYLLLEEERRTGSISLRRFYARRVLRIVPAYWTYIAVVAILIPLGVARADRSQLVSALLYLSDYRLPHGSLTHTWSLCVEEQFYVLWPGALVLCGTPRAYRVCLAALVAAPLFRILSDLGISPTSSKFSFECASDALAIGCLLALLRERLWSLPQYRRLVASKAVFLIPIAALPLMSGFVPFVVRDAVAVPLLNVGTVLLLDRWMRYPASLVGRFLNLPVMVWLGTLSYSLYLWQQLWSFTTLPLGAISRLTATFACACLSYYLIERPVLGLRARLRRVPVADISLKPAGG
jgi:peptidoglycan/LPS O-acetylase OafA/YrhL